MSNKERSEYLTEFRKKNYRQTNIDLKFEVRDKLEEIVKFKNTSIAKWITEKIEEEYKSIK